jgi:hypothetical protein
VRGDGRRRAAGPLAAVAGRIRGARPLPGRIGHPGYPAGQLGTYLPGEGARRAVPGPDAGPQDRALRRPHRGAHGRRDLRGRDADHLRRLVDRGGDRRPRARGPAHPHPGTGQLLRRAGPARFRAGPVPGLDLPRPRRDVLRLPRLRRGRGEGGPRHVRPVRHPADPAVRAGPGADRGGDPVPDQVPAGRRRTGTAQQDLRVRPDRGPELHLGHDSRAAADRLVRRRRACRQVRRPDRAHPGRPGRGRADQLPDRGVLDGPGRGPRPGLPVRLPVLPGGTGAPRPF